MINPQAEVILQTHAQNSPTMTVFLLLVVCSTVTGKMQAFGKQLFQQELQELRTHSAEKTSSIVRSKVQTLAACVDLMVWAAVEESGENILYASC